MNMARKKKNKEEQTFNVYPYLGGYQHFMRNGGALPKAKTGKHKVLQNQAGKINPTNKYKYANTFKGVKDEWNAANDPNYIPMGSMMGQFGSLLSSGVDFGKTVAGAFNKGNYTPGGKYSKFDETGLKHGRMKFTNTTDTDAVMHGENLASYMSMTNKERKKFTEDGGRNTDLWWTDNEISKGKWNYMNDPDGTPTFDGLNYRASKLRNDKYRNPDQGTCSIPAHTTGAACEGAGGVWTGESLFGIKSRNADGDLIYFDNDGNIDMSKQTQYDKIEDGTGTGQLGDANAETMVFDFDKAGPNKLDKFTRNIDHNNDGNVTLEEEEYDPNQEYGNYESTQEIEENTQDITNCTTGRTCGVPGDWITGSGCDCDGDGVAGKYGLEMKNGGAISLYDIGGEEDGDSTAYNYEGKYGTELPRFQGVNNSNEVNFDDVDINAPRNAATQRCSDPQYLNEADCTAIDELTGEPKGQWVDETDMGVDINYGDGPLERFNNKKNEFFNTGAVGATMDALVGGSSEEGCSNPEFQTRQTCEEAGEKWKKSQGTGLTSLLFEKAMPMMQNVMNQNAERSNYLHKRSVSSDDMFAASESGQGAGQRGFYDVNKGGYGDDMYGTGEIFGQVQQGQELIPQQQQQQPQRDLSGLTDFMNQEENVSFDLDFLRKQKNYLGKMNMGGHLPKFQGLTKSQVLNLDDETKKEKKTRIKNYTHPYLQQYYDEFEKKGDISSEKDVRDILSSMNVMPSDTAFVNQSMNQNVVRSMGKMDATQYVGSEMYDDGSGNWSGSVSHNDKVPYFTSEQDEDGNSWDFLTNMFHNDSDNYTGVLKSRKRYGGDLPTFQDGKEKPWYSKAADYGQTLLSGVGLTPGPVGFVSDLINTGVSGTRAGYNTAIGDTESAKIHGENLALNATSMIPGPAGWVAGGTAIAKDMANYTGVTDGNKSLTTQVGDAITTEPIQMAENLNVPKKIANTAQQGGEQFAEIDMDLYYELMQAGADIKIIR